jgi:heme o synthase
VSVEPLACAAAGPWLRLVAIAAALATGLAVISGELHLGTTHRALAALALAPLVAVVVAAITAHRRLLPVAILALTLTLADMALGILVGPGQATVLHLHLAIGVLALAAASASAISSQSGALVVAGSWRDYLVLTKPRVMSLLLLTGAAGMVVGARGLPAPGRVTTTMLGLALACGGAGALNHVIDRDIDRLMGSRTSARPVAAGRIPAAQALEFGLALSAASFALLASSVNVLTALLALAGNLFYVFVYTSWLKRRSRHNIVIGGVAGAIPPLVGYAGASGHVGLAAVLLFVIVVVWTPPHFWALALLLRRQYAEAGIPMLPVVAGERETTRQILAYTVVLIGASALPFAIAGFGLVYLTSALALGAIFLVLALRLRRDTTPRRASVLFHYSLLYLALLFSVAAASVV